ILETYRRFYGLEAPVATLIRYPYDGPVADGDDGFETGGPLRILYDGRLEGRKGVHNLLSALTVLEHRVFRLTLIGGDTDTAPLGQSMRDQLELAIADDERIDLRGFTDRQTVTQAIREHHLVVIPSLWECWPYVALEAMHLNRPILGTPVGGLVEMVAPGRSGWLANGTDPVALEDALARVLGEREELERMVHERSPLEVAQRLSNKAEVLDGYRALAAEPVANARAGRRPRTGSNPPLVSAVVPYFRAARYVREAVVSLLAQSYPELEIVLVNDGSFDEDDWVVAELAARVPMVVVTQMNQGLGAARNFGIGQSQGRYIFPLDCDNVAEPTFVERCVDVLEHRPEVAYVTSWSRYIEDDGTPREAPGLGYQPLGNWAMLTDVDNVAGDAAALLRRRIFDAGFRYSPELTSYEDWALYRQLRQAGHVGLVIPERLLRYRVRDDSMQARIAQPRRARLQGEIEALLLERQMRWRA